VNGIKYLDVIIFYRCTIEISKIKKKTVARAKTARRYVVNLSRLSHWLPIFGYSNTITCTENGVEKKIKNIHILLSSESLGTLLFTRVRNKRYTVCLMLFAHDWWPYRVSTALIYYVFFIVFILYIHITGENKTRTRVGIKIHQKPTLL
jgi:hypothetical protein